MESDSHWKDSWKYVSKASQHDWSDRSSGMGDRSPEVFPPDFESASKRPVANVQRPVALVPATGRKELATGRSSITYETSNLLQNDRSLLGRFKIILWAPKNFVSFLVSHFSNTVFGLQPSVFFLFSLSLNLCAMYTHIIVMRTYFSVDVAHYSGEPCTFVFCMHAYLLTECSHTLRVLTFSIHLIFKLA